MGIAAKRAPSEVLPTSCTAKYTGGLSTPQPAHRGSVRRALARAHRMPGRHPPLDVSDLYCGLSYRRLASTSIVQQSLAYTSFARRALRPRGASSCQDADYYAHQYARPGPARLGSARLGSAWHAMPVAVAVAASVCARVRARARLRVCVHRTRRAEGAASRQFRSPACPALFILLCRVSQRNRAQSLVCSLDWFDPSV